MAQSKKPPNTRLTPRSDTCTQVSEASYPVAHQTPSMQKLQPPRKQSLQTGKSGFKIARASPSSARRPVAGVSITQATGFRRWSARASSGKERKCIFVMPLWRWTFIVLSEIPSSSAMTLFALPCVAMVITSFSRGVTCLETGGLPCSCSAAESLTPSDSKSRLSLTVRSDV